MGDAVYVVAHAHNCSALGGFPEQGTTEQQRALAFRLAPVPGKVNASGDFVPGQPAPELLHWFPHLDVGTYTGQEPGRLEPGRQRPVRRGRRRVPARERRRPAGPGPLRGARHRAQRGRPAGLQHAHPDADRDRRRRGAGRVHRGLRPRQHPADLRPDARRELRVGHRGRPAPPRTPTSGPARR